MKKYIVGFVFGIIVSTVVGVTASALYSSSEVGFTPTDSNWSVNNVESAVNALYTRTTTYKNLTSTTTATAADIVSGKTAYDNSGNLLEGTYVDNCISGVISTSDGYNTDTLSNRYIIDDNGVAVHNWPSGRSLYYIACK